MYRHLNKLYFNNELPDLEIVWEPSGDCMMVTHTLGGEPTRITVDPAIKGYNKIIKLYLCHEMIHVKYPKTHHGRKFDEEIQRLCAFKSYRELL